MANIMSIIVLSQNYCRGCILQHTVAGATTIKHGASHGGKITYVCIITVIYIYTYTYTHCMYIYIYGSRHERASDRDCERGCSEIRERETEIVREVALRSESERQRFQERLL